MENILLNTDSYKASHWLQYPPNTTNVFSYVESRGGKYEKAVFFGLQILLKEYLSKPITQEMIDEAAGFWAAHGEPFNKEGWEYILKEHNGYMPVVIKAVPEGTVVPVKNVLVTVMATDPKCFWVTSYLETMIMRAVWYGTTVATQSWHLKQLIKKSLEKTGDPSGIGFKLHDFGARGVSSMESAGIGGAAHLVNFMGTDTVTGAVYAMRYYNTKEMVAFSIPAAEHSTITSWGKENEAAAYENMLKQYAKPGALVAVVSDSYDIYNAVEKIWGEQLKQKVIDSGAMVVIRPDSGHPASVVLKVARLLEAKFGATMNDKGYKVLNNVRIIQGDGINPDSLKEILSWLNSAKFSTDNIAFGMGGMLLQGINRDTMQFAMKCSAIKVNGVWREVFKDPVTDDGKKSKKGLLTLYRNIDGSGFFTGKMDWMSDNIFAYQGEALVKVFENGKLFNESTFAEVRARSEM